MKRNMITAVLLLILAVVLTGCSSLFETETPSSTATGTGVGTGENNTGIIPPTEVDNYIDGYYAQSVVVTDPYGNNYTDDGSGDLLKLLLSMTKNAERTVYLSFSVDASKYYKAVFSGPAGDVTYKFYFGSSPEECFFESGSGRFYKSNKDACVEFFNSKYSEGAYSLANYPKFTIGSKEIAPNAISWQYKRVDGVYKAPAEDPVLGGEIDIGSIAANVKFKFSTAPTSITVKVVDESGKELYNGGYEGLANIPLKGEIKVKMTVSVKWEKSPQAMCEGSATYTIKANLGPSAVFGIDRTTAKLGEFVVLTCPNTSVDINEIKIKSDPKLDYEPVFFSDGTQLKALLPIPLTTTIKNGVTFTVTAYGSSQDFHVIIEERKNVSSYTVSMITKDTLDVIGVTADPYKMIYADIQADIKQYTTFSRVYKHNGFSLGFDGTLRAKFGDNLKYSPIGSDTLFPSHDYSWVGTFNQDIKAVSDGRVVYVGEHDYTGGLVVVDHGMGLLSWYWNLNTASVEVYVGQEIKQGATIGNNGGGGLTENYNSTNISVHIGLTVFDVPVDIGQLLNN